MVSGTVLKGINTLYIRELIQLKQFHKAIECICAKCVTGTLVNVETITEAKQTLANDHGWRNTHDGWVCEECVAMEDEKHKGAGSNGKHKTV